MPHNQRSCHVQNLSAEIPHENFVGAVLTGQKGGFYKVQSLKLQRDYLDIWSVTKLGGRGTPAVPQQLEAKAFFLSCPVQKLLEAEVKKMRRISNKRTWVDRIDLPGSGKRMLISAIERSRAEWDNLVRSTAPTTARRGSCASIDCPEEYPELSASCPPSSAASSASFARSCSSRATTRMSMYSADSDMVSEPDTEMSFPPRAPSSCGCGPSSAAYYSSHYHGDVRRPTYAEKLAEGLQTAKRKAASAGKGIRQNRRRRRKREERRQQKMKAEAEAHKNGQGV